MKYIILILIIICLSACKHGQDEPTLPPEKALLVFPKQDDLCTQATVISVQQSKLVFQWNAGNHADNYELHVKNLITNDETVKTFTSTSAEITLNNNSPYAWYILSKSTKVAETAKSDTWKFYNAGPGVAFYAPYPAVITAPAMGEQITSSNNNISLSWTGKDVDNDIVSYDVYLGTSSTPPLYKGGLTTTGLSQVSVLPGNIYYWRVLTYDSHNNTSDSGLFLFSVK